LIGGLDLCEDGGVSDKRNFVQVEAAEEGFPDGMAVDIENCI